MIITKKALLKRHPCTTAERVEGFLDCFPGGVVTLEGSLQAARADYDLNWVANKLLPPIPGKAFQEAIAPARRVYRKATAPARMTYRKARDSAERTYWEATAPAERAFQEITAPTRMTYRKALAPAFFRAFQEAMAPAEGAHREAIAKA